MPITPAKYRRSLSGAASTIAVAAALSIPGTVAAQTAVPAQTADQARAAEVVNPAAPSAAEDQRGDTGEIVVTGSRIQRAGFNAPTPTTVFGEIELRQGDPVSVAQVLDDSPQFRATSTPQTTTGNTNNSAAQADLRGLGNVRTLTLLDGHRFTGSFDLNTVPIGLIKRVDVVTGGASAAWGSGAVAGVVDIILADDLKGMTAGVDTGLSTRGDGARYGFNGTFGTSFAGGRGHFEVAGDYLRDDGNFGRADRPNLNSAVFQRADGQLILANNVQYTILNTGGIIVSGPADRQVFNPNGSLSPLKLGSQTFGGFTINGNGQSVYDYIPVSSPYKRSNVFARASFDLSDRAKVWVDGSYSLLTSAFPSFPDATFITVQADNPYLTPTARGQLANLGAKYPLTVGRLLTDIGTEGYLGIHTSRRNLEGSIGLDGSFGKSWKYNVYYDHGELRQDQSITNQPIKTSFNNAVDAVAGPNGQPICRVNAITVTDPGCQPLNLIGQGNASAGAVAYAFGAAREIHTTKLDATGFSMHGQPFSTWAGPVDIAAGGDFRWESYKNNYVDPLSLAGAFAVDNFAPTNGGFNVQEGFGELNVPLLEVAGVVHLELNGAARYSNYSTSGGIWSWKGGGTLRLANDVLLRTTYSRDIRSPTVLEYFTNKAVTIGDVQDPYLNNHTQANVTSYTGGNPALTPETSHTLTVGGSYSPHFIRGLSFSVDYYTIDIKNVISTLTTQDTLTRCFAQSPSDPTCGGTIVRNPDGSIVSISTPFINFASYKTRGLDLEGSYLMPLSNLNGGMSGTLRFRALATYVFDLFADGTDRAGIVGDTTTFSTPKWRATGSINYQDKILGADLRIRYVGGGQFSPQPILNNSINSRTYVDFSVQAKVKQLTVFANVNNLFDRDPPYVTYTSPTYDVIGRYFTAGVKAKF